MSNRAIDILLNAHSDQWLGKERYSLCPPLHHGSSSAPARRGVTRVVRSAVVHPGSDQSPASRVLDTSNRQKVPAALMCSDDKEIPGVP